MQAAIRTFGGALRDSKKKQLQKETSEQKMTEWMNRASNAITSSKVLHGIDRQ